MPNNILVKCLTQDSGDNVAIREDAVWLRLKFGTDIEDYDIQLSANSAFNSQGRPINMAKSEGLPAALAGMTASQRLFLLGHGAGGIRLAGKPGDFWARLLIAYGLRAVRRISILGCATAGQGGQIAEMSIARSLHAALGGRSLDGAWAAPEDQIVRTTVSGRVYTTTVVGGQLIRHANRPTATVKYDSTVGTRETHAGSGDWVHHRASSKAIFTWDGTNQVTAYRVYPSGATAGNARQGGKIQEIEITLSDWDLE